MANYFRVVVHRNYTRGDEVIKKYVEVGNLTKNKGEGHTLHLDILPLLDPKTGRPEKMSIYPKDRQQPTTITKETNDEAL